MCSESLAERYYDERVRLPAEGDAASALLREVLAEGGFGASIWAAADRGEITHDQAPLVVRSLLSAGVDTTVHGIAALLHTLSTHPEEYERLMELAREAAERSARVTPLATYGRATGTA